MSVPAPEQWDMGMAVPPQVTDGVARGQMSTGSAADPQWVDRDASAEWSSLSPEAKHERILCAAGRVFSSDGLDAPMPAVAAAAGAGVGSLYRQFDSKRELLAALVIRRLQQIAQAAREVSAAPAGARWEGLVAMLWRVAERNQADDFLGQAITIVGDHPAVTTAMGRTQSELDRLITATKCEGRLRPDATAVDLRLLFAATRAAKQIEPEAWQRMLTLLIDGLAAPPPR